MARKPSPWYWPERHGWYTILNGQRHHLLDLPADIPPPKKRAGKWVTSPEVDQLFHKLLASPPEETNVPKMSPGQAAPAGPTVPEILDKFL
jgi:hypothetical protein